MLLGSAPRVKFGIFLPSVYNRVETAEVSSVSRELGSPPFFALLSQEAMMRDKGTRRLDAAICFLVLRTLPLLCLRTQSSQPKTGVSLPSPFPLPTARWTFPPPKIVNSSLKVDDKTRAMAESFMIRGCVELGRKNVASALTNFRRARMMVPNEPRYSRQIQRAEHDLETSASWQKIQEELFVKKTDSAWEKFSRFSSKDLDFFLSRAVKFAENLQAIGNTASSVSILLTYCKAMPSDQKGRDCLLRYTGHMGCDPQGVDDLYLVKKKGH